jgi:hypothetical protein
MACSTCRNDHGIYNIVADQGATLQETAVWKDSARTAINVTGYTARMHVRSAIDSEQIVLSLTTENGRISVSGPEGRFDMTVSALDMTSIEAGKYVYDLEIIAPVSGVVDRLMQGNFIVRGEVTR